jgi:alkanesulfonate monooxygenase SsuD/methylene tetrahydromethanopterin reductase-like flavin-dependent oxidoreductase (luciferase family)
LLYGLRERYWAAYNVTSYRAPAQTDSPPKEDTVRFTYAEAMTDPTFYVPLAKAAEAAGYDAMTIADSLAYPFESDSRYPYTPDGNREFLDGKAFVEAFVLAGALSAVTTSLRFNFFVLKLPIRPPALVAKQAGSLAAVFGNRLGLGVGTSPWPEDYELLGVPYAKRGKRMDECIEIIRGLTSGDYFEFHGEFYDIPKTKMTPAPTQPVPILIGGHADAALRRAARCDGWMHGGGDAEELDRLLKRLNQFRDEKGSRDPFEIHVISADGFTVDGVKRLEEKGVTDVIVGFRIPYIMGPDTEPLDVKIRHLEQFAERVITKVNR